MNSPQRRATPKRRDAARYMTREIHDLQDARTEMQKKVFTKWLNAVLKQRGQAVEDLYTEIQDGDLLLNLLHALTGATLWENKYPTFQENTIQHLAKIKAALNFIENNDVNLVNVTAASIANGVPKIVLGLVWQIILRFQITEAVSHIHMLNDESLHDVVDGTKPSSMDDNHHVDQRRRLLSWVQNILTRDPGKAYDVEVNDFGRSWQDGTAFNVLVLNLTPQDHAEAIQKIRDILDRPVDESEGTAGGRGPKDPERASVDMARRRKLRFAFSAAEEQMGVARLLEPEDLDQPDERFIMMYVAQFARVEQQRQRQLSRPHQHQNESPARNTLNEPQPAPSALLDHHAGSETASGHEQPRSDLEVTSLTGADTFQLLQPTELSEEYHRVTPADLSSRDSPWKKQQDENLTGYVSLEVHRQQQSAWEELTTGLSNQQQTKQLVSEPAGGRDLSDTSVREGLQTIEHRVSAVPRRLPQHEPEHPIIGISVTEDQQTNFDRAKEPFYKEDQNQSTPEGPVISCRDPEGQRLQNVEQITERLLKERRPTHTSEGQLHKSAQQQQPEQEEDFEPDHEERFDPSTDGEEEPAEAERVKRERDPTCTTSVNPAHPLGAADSCEEQEGFPEEPVQINSCEEVRIPPAHERHEGLGTLPSLEINWMFVMAVLFVFFTFLLSD